MTLTSESGPKQGARVTMGNRTKKIVNTTTLPIACIASGLLPVFMFFVTCTQTDALSAVDWETVNIIDTKKLCVI